MAFPGAAGATSTPLVGPSAIGPQPAGAIAVSPAYQRTGLVLVTAGSCDKHPCLWASHDGGATWGQVATKGWSGGAPVIAVDGAGHEVLVAGGTGGLQRSDDGGASWTSAGAAGNPSVLPTFAGDGGVAVASGSTAAHDYLSRAGTAHHAAGSGGALIDLVFVPAPDFPAAGGHSPALLLAVDATTRVPSVLQCTDQLACTSPVSFPKSVVQQQSGLPSLAPVTDYAQSGVVFASLGDAAARSSDWGATFTPMPIGDPSASVTSYTAVALSPDYRAGASAHTVYEALLQLWTDTTHPQNSHMGGGVYASSDGGTTWKPTGTPGGANSGTTTLTVAPDGRLFAGYTSMDHGGGLLCSADGGASWKASCPAVGSAATAGGGSSETRGGAGTAAPSAAAVDHGGTTQPAAAGDRGAGGGGDPSVPTAVRAPQTGADRPVSGVPIAAGVLAAVLAALALGAALVRRLRTPR
ncbi:MAG TPA: sialidase family protein [Candidatus Dormibacteraeota bacterium]|nr:sialidase family protein [Candidatus Dormibacteraeota bacterium]